MDAQVVEVVVTEQCGTRPFAGMACLLMLQPGDVRGWPTCVLPCSVVLHSLPTIMPTIRVSDPANPVLHPRPEPPRLHEAIASSRRPSSRCMALPNLISYTVSLTDLHSLKGPLPETLGWRGEGGRWRRGVKSRALSRLLKGGGWGRSTWKDGPLLLLPAVANQWATYIPLTPHASFTPPIHTDTRPATTWAEAYEPAPPLDDKRLTRLTRALLEGTRELEVSERRSRFMRPARDGE